MTAAATPVPLLEVRDLSVEFATDRGPLRAADGVDLTVEESEAVAVVGESGCGKTVTALSLLRLIDPPGRIAGGSIRLRGRELLTLPEREMQRVRGREIAMVFQEPATSLNPLMTVGRQVMEVFEVHQGMGRRAARRSTIELFRMAGIPGSEDRVDQYPHQLSGGMRQRVVIAMALACRPALLVADEPTTALDVTIQAQILDLLDKIRRDLRTSLLLISHDLGVVAGVASRVVVMYAGQVVETAEVGRLFSAPAHPYTQALLAAIPRPGLRKEDPLRAIPGTVPDLRRLPPGCRFAERCRRAFDRCRAEPPGVHPAPGGGSARCFLYAEGAA
jgi:oligopeptide/dipeptide ABC transporter ATP-binding protein